MNNLHFIMPFALVSAIGIALQFVPGYIVFPVVAAVIYLGLNSKKITKPKEQLEKQAESVVQDIVQELLAEEEKAKAKAEAKKKEQQAKKLKVLKESKAQSTPEPGSAKKKGKDDEDDDPRFAANFAKVSGVKLLSATPKAAPAPAPAPAPVAAKKPVVSAAQTEDGWSS
jgi:hypothetical protein